jgi:hypothetical protein
MLSEMLKVVVEKVFGRHTTVGASSCVQVRTEELPMMQTAQTSA